MKIKQRKNFHDLLCMVNVILDEENAHPWNTEKLQYFELVDVIQGLLDHLRTCTEGQSMLIEPMDIIERIRTDNHH